MGQEPYRPPAWPGLKPARPIYAPADPGIATAISAALGIEAPVFALANAGSDTATFRIEDQRTPLFVKLVPASRWSALREAELIAQWLVEQGAPAIAARSLDPPQLPSGELVVTYPFADGRPPLPATDARTIGAGISRIHTTLSAHAGVSDWRARTEQRLNRLVEVRSRIAAGLLAAGPRADDLRALAADREISFLPAAHGTGAARPLHGDLNIFNIVIENDTARFIDFEDVVHSVLPVEHELALVIERVILVQEQSDSSAAIAVDALLDGYAESGGDEVNKRSLPAVLVGLSLRSLCTLALIDPDGTDTAEWLKFFSLIDLVRRRESVFA